MSNCINDFDFIESEEWLEAFDDFCQSNNKDRVTLLMQKLNSRYHSFYKQCDFLSMPLNSEFVNTITVDNEFKYRGDIAIDNRIENFNRWNAIIMVIKANKNNYTLGGHISSGLSVLNLYEVGFNHFFYANSAHRAGDLIFYEGHTTPIIYSRSYLEYRLTDENLDNFRQQAFNISGLSSYPHPYLHPQYWQFPTVSMGLGPLQAIYQARFMKYLYFRNIIDTSKRKVWAFCGDGEMDEPESLGAITHASREKLDNLIFVINCNLQRLDGLVNGNGKIVVTFEKLFIGAGWNVIKILWGKYWDNLFAKDVNGTLRKRLLDINDGQMQFAFSGDKSNLYNSIFSGHPDLEAITKDFNYHDLNNLIYGGHDPVKIFSGYMKAVNNSNGKPTVILAMTSKGYGLGKWGEAKMISHNIKDLPIDALKYIRDRFELPLNNTQVDNMQYIKFDKKSIEYQYLYDNRQRLNGYLPSRYEINEDLSIPHYTIFAQSFLSNNDSRKFSITYAFVKLLSNLIFLDKSLQNRFVIVTVDESRSFGLESLFSKLGIYNCLGQQYISEDKDHITFYKESVDGQIIQDGINESGGFCSWLSAATSYSNHLYTMIPFYMYYSMFGFQRFGDLAWVAGDIKAKGFLLGGISGRTTLNGEGLQHADGHSHIHAGLIPSCISYDPSYAYELSVILWEGMRRMYVKKDNVFYYITLNNEIFYHAKMPKGVEQGIIKGLYLLKKSNQELSNKHVQLMGSGAILREVEAASILLEKDFSISSDVWSLTSSNELYRDGCKVMRLKLLSSSDTTFNKTTYIEKCLKNHHGPVIAASDYVKLYLEQLRHFMPKNYTTLGTDGYGRSDSRKNLRSFFEIDRYYIVISALHALFIDNAITIDIVNFAVKKYNINCNKTDPMYS